MKDENRKWYIDAILKLNPRIGVTFTTLSGKQLKRLYAKERNRAHTSAHPCQAPTTGTLTRSGVDSRISYDDVVGGRGGSVVGDLSDSSDAS